MDNFFERLKRIIDEQAEGKPYRFSGKAGIPSATFQAYLDKRIPKPEHLVRIHETYKVNLNWLLTGIGDRYESNDSNFKLSENHRQELSVAESIDGFINAKEANLDIDKDKRIIKILQMTKEILISNTVYSESLAANVHSFHHAISVEKRLDNLESKGKERNEAIRKGDPVHRKQEILKKRAN